MSDRTLRAKLIKLAYEHPDLREDLLPLVKEAAGPNSIYEYMMHGLGMFMEEVGKKLKKSRTFKSVRTQVKHEILDVSAVVNVQSGWEDEYPELYEGDLKVEFNLVFFPRDWRAGELVLATDRQEYTQNIKTGMIASRVADWVSETLATAAMNGEL